MARVAKVCCPPALPSGNRAAETALPCNVLVAMDFACVAASSIAPTSRTQLALRTGLIVVLRKAGLALLASTKVRVTALGTWKVHEF